MITQRKKTYEIILGKIEEFFVGNDMKAGDKLPPERELAKLFGVSRTSVRDALQALEINGKIEIRQGGGSYIKTTELQNLTDELSVTLAETENQLVVEMLELRRALEVEAASLAAQRANAEELKKIRRSVQEMADSLGNIEAGITADLQFHLQIANATHNQLLINMMQALSERMEDTIRATRNHRLSDPDRFNDTVNEHRDICHAIESGNVKQAKQLTEEHITRILLELETD
ncbi:FadR/GntR family transcriptional regulator [Planococcus salinus]|uniref:FadR family transcriptional regulator n=1 Tax=Planococcus salinus TaxID=1848460 RepID=A0A3M8PC25_9BACL|nr:FadR/GntR family transcriptional regulator [Planococcus salinus]RNF41257.1 FadR family transcriptional regulator [Planococcus salinus]